MMWENGLYRPILKKSWQIVKNFKHLWFFGFFAAILGSGGEYEIITRALNNPRNANGFINEMIYSFRAGFENGLASGGGFWQNIWGSIINNPGSVVLMLLLLVLIAAILVFFIWLALVSQIGLIRNISVLATEKKTNVNEGIDFAVKNFWPVFWINLIFKAATFLILFALGQVTYLIVGKGIIAFYALFILLIIIILIIAFLLKYQIFYILLKKEKFLQAMKSSWGLFRSNWLVSLENALLLFIIYIAAAAISTGVIALCLAAPFAASFMFQWPAYVILSIGIVAIIIMFAVTFILTAFVTAFQWSAWTLLFHRLLSKEGSISKIIRGSQQLTGYFAKK